MSSAKPFYKRPWFIILAVIALIIIVASAAGGSGDGDSPRSEATTGTSVSEPSESAPAAPSAPAADDPLTDDDWTLADVIMGTNPYISSATARVVNNDDSTRTTSLTLTAFVDGKVVGSASGFVTDAEAGSTSTVEFFFTEDLPDAPLTYELQAGF